MSRPLTAREREVLEHLLGVEDPQVARARTFLDQVRVSRSCGCGCGTVDLVVHVPGSAQVHDVVVTEAFVLDDPLGTTVMLFVKEDSGAPSCLEVYDVADDVPPRLPDPRRLSPARLWPQ